MPNVSVIILSPSSVNAVQPIVLAKQEWERPQYIQDTSKFSCKVVILCRKAASISVQCVHLLLWFFRIPKEYLRVSDGFQPHYKLEYVSNPIRHSEFYLIPSDTFLTYRRTTTPSVVVLLYVKGVSEGIRWILATLKIRVCFKPHQTLGNLSDTLRYFFDVQKNHNTFCCGSSVRQRSIWRYQVDFSPPKNWSMFQTPSDTQKPNIETKGSAPPTTEVWCGLQNSLRWLSCLHWPDRSKTKYCIMEHKRAYVRLTSTLRPSQNMFGMQVTTLTGTMSLF